MEYTSKKSCSIWTVCPCSIRKSGPTYVGLEDGCGEAGGNPAQPRHGDRKPVPARHRSTGKL